MIAKIFTVAFQGIEPLEVSVQSQISSGLPAFQIVGLADKAVAESRERIRSSLHSIGLSLPAKRITINLAPADLQKEGSHYDLPIAMSIMACMNILPIEEVIKYTAIGELGLDGTIAKVAGILPATIDAFAKGRGIICPFECGNEASWAGNPEILAIKDLISIINHFNGKQIIMPPNKLEIKPDNQTQIDFQDVKGQELAKRALEIAAAGGHNLLMVGSPGCGKSMLAKRLPTILPELSPQEALEVTIIHSISGKLPENGLIKKRPFRDPHHSASLPAIIGGGNKSKPGEISLSHHGILFLDELAEFAKQTLEALRQPLETGSVSIARVQNHVTYPARFQLIGAMNPCRCGFFGNLKKQCYKAPKCAQDYQQKLSGPLLDRFDMVINVKPLEIKDLSYDENKLPENSKIIAQRVLNARQIQNNRFQKYEHTLNATIDGRLLAFFCKLSNEGQKIMDKATEKFELSARGYHRILKVSRTIADLDNQQDIQEQHLLEAISYRNHFSGSIL
jgi:magnesium chelatase family protein